MHPIIPPELLHPELFIPAATMLVRLLSVAESVAAVPHAEKKSSISCCKPNESVVDSESVESVPLSYSVSN